MELRKIQDVELNIYKQFLVECAADRSGFYIGPVGLGEAAVVTYVQREKDAHAGKNLPAGMVPMTTYLLIKDEKCVGLARLRHQLNQNLRRIGGHISYYIHPGYRQQGLGTRLLAMTLGEAAAIGLSKVLITCDDDNQGSIGVIENNRGILEDRSFMEERGKLIRRYWITIEP
jgi:predicted acetyltransferase